MANSENHLGKLDTGNNHARKDKFSAELESTELTIFKPLRDLGYFSWDPKGVFYKSLSSIRSEKEVTFHIDLNGMPDLLLPLRKIKMPRNFQYPPQTAFENEFPHGEVEVASVYAASKRGQDLNDVDFCFGGSTLEMLANKDASDPFIASRVQGTKCIIIARKKNYIKNLADVGYQFERYVTGGDMMNTAPTASVEHIHMVRVGNKMVLFRAEVDAIDDDGPIEIKASNPHYWGTKVMFQMIGSGSSKLCHGEKYRGVLSRVTLKSLSSMASTALQNSDASKLQKNILDGMDEITSQLQDDGIYEICFKNGSLVLAPTSARVCVRTVPI